MSALIERLIAARDFMKIIRAQYPEGDSFKLDAHDAVNALADAANALRERDETAHAQRSKIAKLEASNTELLKCARYVKDAANAIEGTDRGRELARMIENRCGDRQQTSTGPTQ